MSDDEFFTRLIYYGVVQLQLTMDETWLMPFGLLMDLIECHRQYMGQNSGEQDDAEYLDADAFADL